jgi:YD repeat-containing protein
VLATALVGGRGVSASELGFAPDTLAYTEELLGFYYFTSCRGDDERWSFAYNGRGELVRQTDANGRVSSFAYDRRGRMRMRAADGVLESVWTIMAIGSPSNVWGQRSWRRSRSMSLIWNAFVWTPLLDWTRSS